MTNEELVSRIKAGENVRENMEQLYFQVQAFIHSMALKYKGQADIEDLEQEGYLALYPAINAYDMEVFDFCEKLDKAADAAVYAKQSKLPAVAGALPGKSEPVSAVCFGVCFRIWAGANRRRNSRGIGLELGNGD